jgi:WD40 repeat protein
MTAKSIQWDAATGNKLRTLAGHNGGVTAIAFAPDGKQVATASSDHTAIIWDAATGTKIHALQGHSNGISSLAFGRDGKQLLTGGGDGATIIWNVADGKQIARLVNFEAGKEWAVVTPEGFYDGSKEGLKRITIRADRELKVSPAERATPARYRPGLLGAVLRGERPMP